MSSRPKLKKIRKVETRLRGDAMLEEIAAMYELAGEPPVIRQFHRRRCRGCGEKRSFGVEHNGSFVCHPCLQGAGIESSTICGDGMTTNGYWHVGEKVQLSNGEQMVVSEIRDGNVIWKKC